MNFPQKYTHYSLLVLFIACATTPSTVSTIIQPLAGSWQLVKYKTQGASNWSEYGDSILYEKHLIDNFFVWFKYDTRNNDLLGMGGGTYSFKNNQYVENILFFYPPGSSELGQSIPFDMKMKNGKWYHSGYSKVLEINAETGAIEVTDSTRIDEQWQRVEHAPNRNRTLVGLWDLEAYRTKRSGSYIEYPEYVCYMKLITPTHFTWVYFNREQDEIYAAGSGNYVFYDNRYSENIKMIYPKNDWEVGSTFSFETRLKNNKWEHLGSLTFTEPSEDKSGTIIDSLLIDEIWKPHKATQ